MTSGSFFSSSPSALSSVVCESLLELASEERLVGSWGISASSPRGMTEPGPRISSFSTERETGKRSCDGFFLGDDLNPFLFCGVLFFKDGFSLFLVMSASSGILQSLVETVFSEVAGLVCNSPCFEVLTLSVVPISVVEEGESGVFERDNASPFPATVVDCILPRCFLC